MLEKEEVIQEKLDQLDKERQIAKGQLDRERLIRVSGDLIQTMTSPTFVEKMRQAREAADAGTDLQAAVGLLSIEGLRQSGVDIPSDFRLTSRVFEDRAQGVRLELKSDLGRGSGPVPDFGVCVCMGSLGLCGCAGFSLRD